MDLDRKLERDVARLCHRHGLPAESGWRFLPILRQAQAGPPAARTQLLAAVETALANEAAERSERRALQAPFDRQCLVTLARILH